MLLWVSREVYPCSKYFDIRLLVPMSYPKLWNYSFLWFINLFQWLSMAAVPMIPHDVRCFFDDLRWLSNEQIRRVYNLFPMYHPGPPLGDSISDASRLWISISFCVSLGRLINGNVQAVQYYPKSIPISKNLRKYLSDVQTYLLSTFLFTQTQMDFILFDVD